MSQNHESTWSSAPPPATHRFTATSDDQMVSATVSAQLDVLRVRIVEGCDPEVAAAGIVQAVNRALEKADGQPIEELQRARVARMQEFNALIDGLESEVARGRTSGRTDRRRS